MSAAIVRNLKEADEDFEWYPTTQAIMEEIRADLVTMVKTNKIRGYTRDNQFKFENNHNNKDIAHLGNILDIGAGDGRVLEYLKKDQDDYTVYADIYAIEKATLHANKLIKDGVALIGRDFKEISLFDKTYNVVFSNPPYSEYESWTKKILEEVNAKVIYLVIPKRWRDTDLYFMAEDKGEVSNLGQFDFLDADRKARATVEIIRIDMRDKKSDTFNDWIAKNIGTFDKVQDVEFEDYSDEDSEEMQKHEDKIIQVLVKNYNEDLAEMVSNYKKLGQMDFKVIEQLGVTKEVVLKTLKDDIKSLKNRYWHKMLDHTNTITERLTSKMRKNIFSSISWFQELDFTAGNAYSVVIWVIENTNKYTKQQAMEVYDKLMSFDNVTAYKSNSKWTDGGWRYNNEKMPEKCSLKLDYRIVVENGYVKSYRYEANHSIYDDLAIVAESFGFENNSCYKVDTGEKGYCFPKVEGDDLVFEYKRFKNGNVHLKINQDFLMKLNVEIGKLKGWIMKPKDIENEFEVSEDKALKLFGTNNLTLIGQNDVKLLEAI